MEYKEDHIEPGSELEAKDNSRRDFLKQSALLTAIALTPGTAVKAASMASAAPVPSISTVTGYCHALHWV